MLQFNFFNVPDSTIEDVYVALDLQTTLQNFNEIPSFLWKFSGFRQRQLHFADILQIVVVIAGNSR